MKNYLVIGASSGIGKKIAENLSADGNKVYGTYFKNKIESDNELLEYHYLDVMDENFTLDFLPESVFGLVYCPGSINLKPFNRIKAEEFSADFNLQVIGAVRIIQEVLPKLRSAENASIVLFSTVAVQNGFNFHSQVSASKGAVEGLARALAAELAPRIRVNAIAPSITHTPLASKLLGSDEKIETAAKRHPLKRIGQPGDIADAATFLLSSKSSWISGQIIHVDGGISSIKI